MRKAIAAAVGAALFGSTALACELHLNSYVTKPLTVEVPELTFAPAFTPAGGDTIAAAEIAEPSITSWQQNLTGVKGTSPNATINSYVSVVNADVQTVGYNATSVYVNASGVPSHSVGPFPGNPATPTDRNRTFRIPRTPQVQAGAKTAMPLGPIAVMANGVPLYDQSDARSYNNANVWHQNANVAEAASFDTGPGHPNPNAGATGNPLPGTYHYHQAPKALINQLDPGNTGQSHSPVIGYAFDGFPVYGPYGFADPDGSGGIERIESSYRMRNITQRTTLPNGSAASSAGPAVGGAFPLGYYLEDFEFVLGLGDLDEFNGRFAVTPEYPQGTYAYFATMTAAGAAAYPYVLGRSFYGVVANDNFGPNGVTAPGGLTYFVAPEPGAAALCGIFLACGLLRRGRARH